MSNSIPRKSRGFRQTGACLSGSVRKVTEKRGFAETRLLTDWADICGPDLAAIASPVRVTHAKEGFGATLIVYCSGARAPEVAMQRDLIRERVNACYGYNAIQRVKITQTGAPVSGFREEEAHFVPKTVRREIPQAMASALEPIGDSGLRNALKQLGENVLNRDAVGAVEKGQT